MKTKRILSVVLAMAMVLGTMGTVVFAEEEEISVAVAKIDEVEYTTLQEAFDALAISGGTLELLSDVDASDYKNPILINQTSVIDGKGFAITGLSIPLVKNVSSVTAEFKNLTIDGANITNADSYANRMGVGAYVCWINVSGAVVFTNCNLINSVIKSETNGVRIGGFIGYCDGTGVDVIGGKVDNCEITANDCASAVVGWIDKPFVVDGVAVTSNTVTSTENRTSVIAGAIVGTITSESGVATVNAIANGNITSQNISGEYTPVTTIYGRVINGASLTITGGKYDDEPIVVDESAKYDSGLYWDIETGEVKEMIVAKIGEVGYKTLETAIEAADEGDTIEVLADEIEMPIKLKDNLTFKTSVGTKITNSINHHTDSGATGKAITFDGFEFKNQVRYCVADMTFLNCSFTGKYGIYSGASSGVWTIDNCVINPTYAYGLQDGDGNGTINVTNSVITSWSAFGSNVTVNFDNCTFKKGNSSYSVLRTYGKIKISNSVFEEDWDDVDNQFDTTSETAVIEIYNTEFKPGSIFGHIGDNYGILVADPAKNEGGLYTGGTFSKIPAEEMLADGAVAHMIDGGLYIVHAAIAEVAAKVETCTEDGNHEYYFCSCGKYFSDNDCNTEITLENVIIPATGHKEESTEKEATCTKQGYTAHTCSECGNYRISAYVDALGHDWNKGEITTEATSDKNGIKTYKCTREDCNASYTEAIPAKGHVFKVTETVEATCTRDGYAEYTCTTCKPGTHSYKTDYVKAKGHSLTSEPVAATCTAKGYTEHKCGACTYSFRNNVTAMTPHTYDVTKTIEATSDIDGKKIYTCTADGCKDSYEEVIPKLGHVFTDVTVAPTCTTQGYTVYTCTNCEESTHTYEANYVPAKAHTWVAGVVKPSTCISTGYTNFECSVCHTTKKDKYTAMGNHDFDEETHICKNEDCGVKDVNHIEENSLEASVETLSAVPENLNYKNTEELKSDMKNTAESAVASEKEIKSEIYDIKLKADDATLSANNFPEDGHIFKIEIPNDAPKTAKFIVCHMITESYDDKTAGDIEILDSWVEDGYICFRTNSTSPILVSWEESTEVSTTPSTGGGTSTSYTVTFNSNGGSKVESIKARRGNTIKEPTAPTKDGYIFDGWYKDSEFATKFNFASTTIIKDITLYAKWIKDGEEADSDDSKDDTVIAAPQSGYNDVSAKDWYFDAVKFVTDNKLMNGVSEKEFAPNAELTRAMLVTILYRNEGEPEIAEKLDFTDVKEEFYYVNAVAWAKANGIVNGVTDTKFEPDTNITREQIATILFRYAQYKGMDAVNMAENLGSFTDSVQISEYAVSALNWAVGSGLINGKTETTLNPQDNATRAEIATILQRFIEANK